MEHLVHYTDVAGVAHQRWFRESELEQILQRGE
jgi:hypothetical protein